MDIRNLLSDVLDNGTTFQVKVAPRASSNRIVLDLDADGPPIRVYVTTVPESGRANAAVIKLLAKALGVPKSSLTLLRGNTSRIKTFVIRC